MRSALALFLAMAMPVVLSGCLADVLVSTAIQGELQAKQAQTLTRTLNNVKETKSEIEVNSAIQAYSGENGKYPASLNDLVPAYFPTVPVKPDGSPYNYDPATGKLVDTPMIVAPARAVTGPSNDQRMKQIKDAMTKYGMATGYYPPTLQALVPTYLPAVPLTEKGAAFIYVPETGELFDPTGTVRDVPVAGGGTLAQTPQQVTSPQPRSPGAVGGSPVMGEVMTGIGISNQLDNMSSAGSSAAGSAARGDARAIGQESDARQQQVMNDLGL